MPISGLQKRFSIRLVSTIYQLFTNDLILPYRTYRCESICRMDFLSVHICLWHETTRNIGLALAY
ncbi:hypothetical protein AMTRI_Chr13g82650 [Amborella trichopoda]